MVNLLTLTITVYLSSMYINTVVMLYCVPCSYLVPVMVAKLTRQQVKELLPSVDLSTLLTNSSKTLTAKEKKFCQHIAEGASGADAYRKSYNTKGKPKMVGNKASALKKKDGIQEEIDHIKEAIEFRKLYTEAQLKALIVSRLTKEALDLENPPAVRVSSLKTLGSVAGVDAFQHIATTTIIHDSTTARAKLFDQLKRAIEDNKRTVDTDAMSLLDEIKLGGAQNAEANGQTETLPLPDPQDSIDDGVTLLHSTSLKELPNSHGFNKDE